MTTTERIDTHLDKLGIAPASEHSPGARVQLLPRDVRLVYYLRSRGKELRAEIDSQRATIWEMSRAARIYAEECRAKASEATKSELGMKAKLICAQDELRQLAEDFRGHAESLCVPIRVLNDHGFAQDGVNPLKVVRDLQSYLGQKAKALTKFKGAA